MQVTEVRVSVRSEERLKAYCTITFDHCFVVRHVRIVLTDKGLLVCMPSRKSEDGQHYDICHPINREFRKVIEDAVLLEYERELERLGRAA